MFRDHPLVDVHRWTNRNPRYEGECFLAQTASTAIRWLEENDGVQPFFLWIDFFDLHEPWDPPEYMVRRYDPGYTRLVQGDRPITGLPPQACGTPASKGGSAHDIF